MFEQVYGDYRFTRSSDVFSIESTRTIILKATKKTSQHIPGTFYWVLQCSGETFSSFKQLWAYISVWLNDVKDTIWPIERSNDYYNHVQAIFCGDLNEEVSDLVL